MKTICCEVRIENFVTRVTVRHHEACRAVIASDGIFYSQRTAIMDAFSCILFLQQQHLSLHTSYFVTFTPNICIFGQEIFGSATNFDVDIGTFGGK